MINPEKSSGGFKDLREDRSPFLGIFSRQNLPNLLRYSLLLSFSLVIAAILVPDTKPPVRSYRPGDIARETIHVESSYDILDEEQTAKARVEAARLTPPVFTYFPLQNREYDKVIPVDFEKMRRLIVGKTNQSRVKVTFEELIQNKVTQREANLLYRQRYSKALQAIIIDSLSRLEDSYIANRNLDARFAPTGNITIISKAEEDETKEFSLKVGAVVNQKDLNRIIIDEIEENLDQKVNLPRRDVRSLAKLIKRYLKPNLVYDKEETESRKVAAKEAVKDIKILLQEGEVIVRRGDRIQSRHLLIFSGMQRAHSGFSSLQVLLAIWLLIIIFGAASYRLIESYMTKSKQTWQDRFLLAIALVANIILARFVFQFLIKWIANASPEIPVEILHYMIPFAGSAMVIRMILNPSVAVWFSVVISFLVGVLFGFNFSIMSYTFLSCVIGAILAGQIQTRSSLIRNCLYLGLFNFVIALLLALTPGSSFTTGIVLPIFFLAMSSGILSILVITVGVWITERFDYLTDLRLIELLNFNHPLLNRLALEAPGSYHHSRVVAQLVEAAAESIGANPLLATVSALYHDIGKIKQPQYFVENQSDPKDNPHEKLKPSMSKMIVVSHVKDGIEMAKRANLPRAVIDAIPEHHGTALITYFYQKAKDQEDPEVETTDESEYRYPGPKPQSRETGLLMLADSVEATTKSLTDPTPAKIQGVIQTTFNKYFADGQLDECDLTLKDLNLIAKSFHRTLSSVYKARIEYPGGEAKATGKDKKSDAHRNQQPSNEDGDKNNQSEKDSRKDLKRLGM